MGFQNRNGELLKAVKINSLLKSHCPFYRFGMEPQNQTKISGPAADQNQNALPTIWSRILNQQQQEVPIANVGGTYTYTKSFTWEITNVMSLAEPGEYVQSEIFTSKGPYGQQDVKWTLSLFPKGKKRVIPKNRPSVPVPVYLHLLDGNGSNYVKVDWKLAIINETGNKVNQQEQKSCLFDLEGDTNDTGWVFPNYMTRATLDTKYTVGNKLTLISEISVKVEKDLQAELLQKRELAKNLKRKLDGKEAEIGKIRSENEQNQKRIRAERQKLKGDHSATIEKYKKEEEERSNQLHLENEQRLTVLRAKIVNLSTDKTALEKRLKDEEERHSNLQKQLNLEKSAAIEKYSAEKERSNQFCLEYEQKLKRSGEEIQKLEKDKLAAAEKCNKLEGKYVKMSEFMRNSSKFLEEIEKEDADDNGLA